MEAATNTAASRTLFIENMAEAADPAGVMPRYAAFRCGFGRSAGPHHRDIVQDCCTTMVGYAFQRWQDVCRTRYEATAYKRQVSGMPFSS
jgi:hypothetical protein